MENARLGERQEEEPMPSTSSQHPSQLPAMPRNGTIKTYENSLRTFDSPYAAKTVFFYKDNDVFFTGVRMAISGSRYRNIHMLMDDLNKTMFLPYGVRKITTPMGRENITHINQLQHLGKYVASSSNPPKGVDLDKIQENLSATQRKTPVINRTTGGGQAYWMPTSPPPPHLRPSVNGLRLRFLEMPMTKHIHFALNGKGKFYRLLINPMKAPPMEKILEDCSANLGIAIHTFYTPEGKLIPSVEDLLAYDGERVIACPRNERPHIEENAALAHRIPDYKAPKHAYAPRTIPVKNEPIIQPTASAIVDTSNSSSGNSIEKRYRERVPLPQRYVPRNRRDPNNSNGPSINGSSMLNGTSNGTHEPTQTTTNNSGPSTTPYVPKTFASLRGPKPQQKIPEKVQNAPQPSQPSKKPQIARKAPEKMVKKTQEPPAKREDTALSSAASTKKSDDSGTGASINQSISSSQQSERGERPESMTERKAQMIRDEFLKANKGLKSTSEESSEEDRIIEEDSDFDHVVPHQIQSGTDEEEENEDSALGSGSRSKQSPLPRRGTSLSHRTPALRTPSTSDSNRSEIENSEKNGKNDISLSRNQSISRQNTPYNATPSKPSTAESNVSSFSKSTRPKTTESRRIEDLEEESEASEDEELVEETETPASHTPDTRQPTAKSRLSTRESMRSFESESSKAWSRVSKNSDMEQQLPSSDEESDETPILGKNVKFEDYGILPTPERERLGLAADKIKRGMRNLVVNKKKVAFEEEERRKIEEEIRLAKEYEASLITYTVEMQLGDRFGIDFDTQIYVILVNEDGEKSEKIWTERNQWLSSDLNNYNPGDWVFMNKRVPKMGIIRNIIIGHEMEGYGAGTFIERVIISENNTLEKEERQFLFVVEKWFDSGQVDGLIERTVPLSSFMYLPVVEREKEEKFKRRPSRGRWEFRLHTVESEIGGTTSNMTVIGYGQRDYSINDVPNDSLFRDPDSVPILQFDFGIDMGRLRKVRFEIDGSGDKPNYYLDYVEAMDLDTKERCVLMVHDWLTTVPERKNQRYQGFREVAIYQKDYPPGSVRTFEGTVKLSHEPNFLNIPRIETPTSSDKPVFFLQYISFGASEDDIQIDESGIFPVIRTVSKSGKINYVFKVDLVTLDKTPFIRILPDTSKFGTDTMAGMGAISEIFDDMIDRDVILPKKVWVGKGLILEEIHQNGGDHIPYGTIYRKSAIDFERNNMKGPYFKQVEATVGYSTLTARKWKKSEEKPRVEPMAEWHLHMVLMIGDYTPVIPTVVLVAKDRRTYEMDCDIRINEGMHQGDMIALAYTLQCENFGNPQKIRISCEEVEGGLDVFVHKAILLERYSNTHIFVKVGSKLDELDTQEIECIYPDVGPSLLKSYELLITTLEGGGDFRPYINIIGEKGDTGYRAYAGIKKFEPEMDRDMLTFALDLGYLQNLEVWVKTGYPKSWKGTIRIYLENEDVYQSGIIELNKNGQIALSTLELLPRLEIEDYEENGEEEGEAAI